MYNMQAETPESVEEQLEFIQEANDLRLVNDLLTQVMAKMKIQALIKEDNLSLISNVVVDLALMGDGDEDENRLIAAAILGRIHEVAGTRKSLVFARISELFESMPLPVENLADGKERYYAALSIAAMDCDWLADYCHRQSVLIDTAENARRVFLDTALRLAGSLSKFWQGALPYMDELQSITSNESRYKRIRRIASATSEAVRDWQGEVGSDAGLALADWLSSLLGTSKKDVEEEVLTDILDESLAMLLRIIELRFSNALLPPTYSMLDSARSAFGRQGWTDLMRVSKNLEKIRIALKEAALVLARQDKQDPDLMDVLVTVYGAREHVMLPISAHFSDARDLIPETKAWWEQGGNLKKSQRQVDHTIGNSEDQQIGSLLINVEDSKMVMEKLERAVVPFLEISDPPLAETVKKAAGSYSEIALAARQLATMRKLKRMDQKGEILDYMPMHHEMLGGHKLGVRKVKVERDGIMKEFGGKPKVLVKPRVTPVE